MAVNDWTVLTDAHRGRTCNDLTLRSPVLRSWQNWQEDGVHQPNVILRIFDTKPNRLSWLNQEIIESKLCFSLAQFWTFWCVLERQRQSFLFHIYIIIFKIIILILGNYRKLPMHYIFYCIFANSNHQRKRSTHHELATEIASIYQPELSFGSWKSSGDDVSGYEFQCRLANVIVTNVL